MVPESLDCRRDSSLARAAHRGGAGGVQDSALVNAIARASKAALELLPVAELQKENAELRAMLKVSTSTENEMNHRLPPIDAGAPPGSSSKAVARSTSSPSIATIRWASPAHYPEIRPVVQAGILPTGLRQTRPQPAQRSQDRQDRRRGNPVLVVGLHSRWPTARAVLTAPTSRQIDKVDYRAIRAMRRNAGNRITGVEVFDVPTRGCIFEDGREIIAFSTDAGENFAD